MMKRITCFMMTMVLMICVIIPVNAYSPNDNQISGIELSARRFSAKLSGKSDVIFAKEILAEFGMQENTIKQIPDEKLNEIAQSKNIGSVTEYCKIVDSVQTVISKDEFQKEKLAANSEKQLRLPGNNGGSYGTDELLKKQLFFYETKNAPHGTYGIITTFEFVNYSIQYHGEDFLVQRGEHLVFDKTSFYMYALYSYEMTTGIGTSHGTKEDIFDYNKISTDKSLENDLKQEDYGISFQYNLKNHILSPIAPLIYNSAHFMIMSSAVLDMPQQVINFSIKGDYYHQKLGLGSVGVSISIKGAGVSVLPSFIYDHHMISTKPITYTPY